MGAAPDRVVDFSGQQLEVVAGPAGASVTLDSDPAHPEVVTKAALLRTARLLMRGEVMVPRSVWDGRRQD